MIASNCSVSLIVQQSIIVSNLFSCLIPYKFMAQSTILTTLYAQLERKIKIGYRFKVIIKYEKNIIDL